MSCRIALLISGSGSNLQALLDACADGRIAGRPVLVLSNRADAYGLERAQRAGVPTATIEHTDFAQRADFDAALAQELHAHRPDLVVLAGFMRILTPEFVQQFQGRLLNIHPSLLPRYPGLNTHQRALEAGDQQAGATVHFVTEQLDGGPAVIQARVPILPGDDAQQLADRVLEVEHEIYPLAVAWFASGRLQLKEGQAWLDGQPLPATGHAHEAVTSRPC